MKKTIIDGSAWPGSGFEADVMSPSNVAYNTYGQTAAISKAGGTFDFIGAWFTSAWISQEISFEGSRDGRLLYSTGVAYALDTLTPQWIELDWSGIDTLSVYDSSGTQWAMDEFTVPEPASTALFGTSLAGLLLSRRRKRLPA